MTNFRDFQAGPDPFGRSYHVLLKWMQTAIAIRGADTMDVKFIVETDEGSREEKVIAIPHAEMTALSKRTGRPVTDAWCGRVAAAHLRYMIETAEDMEKPLVTLTPEQLAHYDHEDAQALLAAAKA